MENEQKKIAAYIYDLEPAEGNAQQEIPLTLLVKRILETATYHAENWGVGYSTLIKENRAWVLARLAIEMSSYPGCLLYTSPSPRDGLLSRMPSSA